MSPTTLGLGVGLALAIGVILLVLSFQAPDPPVAILQDQ